ARSSSLQRAGNWSHESLRRLYSMRSRSLIVLCIAAILCCILPLAAFAQTVPNWAPNTAYKVGDLVIFNGQEFRCIQAHTSQVDWQPPNVPALWSLVSGTPPPTPT